MSLDHHHLLNLAAHFASIVMRIKSFSLVHGQAFVAKLSRPVSGSDKRKKWLLSGKGSPRPINLIKEFDLSKVFSSRPFWSTLDEKVRERDERKALVSPRSFNFLTPQGASEVRTIKSLLSSFEEESWLSASSLIPIETKVFYEVRLTLHDPFLALPFNLNHKKMVQ